MVNPNFLLLTAMNSSLWIAVLVVHVGCIIDAQPSKSPTISSLSSSASLIDEKRSQASTFELVPAASISASYSSRQNNFGRNNLVQRSYRGRKFIFQSTTPITTISTRDVSTHSTTEAYDDDSCTGKLDGYYQNFGSSCTSYYFCAAGYQITYVCPQGEKFSDLLLRCDEEYECRQKKGHVNLCKDAPNGYYSNIKSPGKYFYCFQKAKVIDLQCDAGKVFVVDKCIFPMENDQPTDSKLQDKNEDHPSCTKKANGFYPDKQTGCKKYFYCINGEKTELSCQPGFLFNGDICVHNSRFICPYLSVSGSTTESHEILLGSNDIEITSRERPSSDITNVTDRYIQSPTSDTTTGSTRGTTSEGSIKTG